MNVRWRRKGIESPPRRSCCACEEHDRPLTHNNGGHARMPGSSTGLYIPMKQVSLALAFALVLFSPIAFAQASFAGTWVGDETLVLHQNGTRVCGFWEYQATGRFYEGQLVAIARGNQLTIVETCGTPGGTAQTWCPESAPRGESNIGWSPSNQSAMLCRDKLLVSQANELSSACASLPKDWEFGALTRYTGHKRQIRKLDPTEQEWLKACLAI